MPERGTPPGSYSNSEYYYPLTRCVLAKWRERVYYSLHFVFRRFMRSENIVFNRRRTEHFRLTKIPLQYSAVSISVIKL